MVCETLDQKTSLKREHKEMELGGLGQRYLALEVPSKCLLCQRCLDRPYMHVYPSSHSLCYSGLIEAFFSVMCCVSTKFSTMLLAYVISEHVLQVLSRIRSWKC